MSRRSQCNYLCVLTLGLVVSCAAPPPYPWSSISIAVTHLPEIDSWRLDYELWQPMDRMIFARTATLFRAGSWNVLTNGIEISREGKHEIVRRVDGRPFQRFSIVAPSSTDISPETKDYVQNYTFTDGSQLLYTGHFTIAPNDIDPFEYTLRLVPAAGEAIVVRGRYHQNAVEIEEPGDDGLFAYFGGLHPQQNEHYIAIVDPALPPWLGETLSTYLPKLFDYYSKRLRVNLPRRPSIYFNYHAGDSEGTHFAGGALLDGTFQLSVIGHAWLEPDPELRSIVPTSIAHEAVHLWNGHMTAGLAGEGGAWIHEGGAEVLAWRAMRDLGFLSEAAHDAKVCDAYRHCAEGLKGRALSAAADGGDYQLLYTCGAVIGRITELSMQHRNADIFDFWADLLESRSQREGFSQQIYFEALEKQATNQELVAFLKHIVSENHGNTEIVLRQALETVGARALCAVDKH